MSERTGPTRDMLAMLRALQPDVSSGKHVYAGTVPESTVRRRRAANKVARRSRQVNRKRR
ncbi:hypothetical protein [Phytoactinopolyspora limicola]|uniref:hypothetical protein n=1 Tax=Phytoactinopolyspora limicola TaxID=2715536 RepID=UPI00140B1A5E|nr:hypothetical protein [Phytoactinopolyspora limicola]